MWRPTDWLTSEIVCSVLSIMPALSPAQPFTVWYCFTTGKTFCQRPWIPEPSWNSQRMFFPLCEMSCFCLRSHKYWSLTLRNITHYSPAILIAHFEKHYAFLEPSSCVSADGSDPQCSTSHLARVQLQPRHQSELQHVGAKTKQYVT